MATRTLYWNETSSGQWSEAAKWREGSPPPPIHTDRVILYSGTMPTLITWTDTSIKRKILPHSKLEYIPFRRSNS
jgi:hypothetical protein